MKLLLDNCVPKRAKRLFLGHTVSHCSEVGLSELDNGDLLRAAAAQGFDVLITVDQKMRHEHRFDTLPIAILELDTRDSRLPAISAMAPHFERALTATTSCRFVSLDASGGILRIAEPAGG